MDHKHLLEVPGNDPAGEAGHTPDVKTLPAGTRLYKIYFQGGDHQGGWDRVRSFGRLPNARFDHHTGPPGIQERAILYAALWEGAIATCVAEAFQETRLVDTRRRDPQLRLRVIWERVISERASSKRSYRGGHAEARATLIPDEGAA